MYLLFFIFYLFARANQPKPTKQSTCNANKTARIVPTHNPPEIQPKSRDPTGGYIQPGADTRIGRPAHLEHPIRGRGSIYLRAG